MDPSRTKPATRGPHITTSPRSQRVLVRGSGSLDCRAQLLCDGAAHQSPNDVTSHNATNSSCWFLEGRDLPIATHLPLHEGLCCRQRLRHPEETVQHPGRFQHWTNVFRRHARWPWRSASPERPEILGELPLVQFKCTGWLKCQQIGRQWFSWMGGRRCGLETSCRVWIEPGAKAAPSSACLLAESSPSWTRLCARTGLLGRPPFGAPPFGAPPFGAPFFLRDDGHNLSRATGDSSPAEPCVVLIPLNLMVRGRETVHPMSTGAPTGKLQRPVQLHRRELRTNEDAMPVPYAASSKAARLFHTPPHQKCRPGASLGEQLHESPASCDQRPPPPPEPEPPGAPCYLAARVQGMLFPMDLAYMCVKHQMRLYVCQALPPANTKCVNMCVTICVYMCVTKCVYMCVTKCVQ